MFIQFLKTINCWINEPLKIRHLKIMIIFDNLPNHRSKLMLEFIKTKDRVYEFLPQYTTSLAPNRLLFPKMKKHWSE